MLLTCVKKGQQPIDANVSETLALQALLSDGDGGRAISMVTATPTVAVAA